MDLLYMNRFLRDKVNIRATIFFFTFDRYNLLN